MKKLFSSSPQWPHGIGALGKGNKLLALILFGSISTGLYAQNHTTGEQTTYVQIPSAQTFSFMKYGNTPVNYNTGVAVLNVPIYTYQDEDFVIPISATYASEGYKPARQSGYLGHNWSLSFGGVITREVRGVPDEKTAGMGSYAVGGSLQRPTTTNYSESNLLALPAINNTESGYTVEVNENEVVKKYELEPDLFHFNFMGYRGSFVVDGQKQIRVFNTESAGEIKVAVLNILHDGTLMSMTSKIVMITGDGYKYTFGGSHASVEYNVELQSNGSGQTISYTPSGRGVVNSWYLSKIETPNGRSATLDYLPNSDNRIDQWSSLASGHYVVTPNRFNYVHANLTSDAADALKSRLMGDPAQIVYDIQKVVYPSKITVDNLFLISFAYQTKASEYTASLITQSQQKLISVTCQDLITNKILENCTFAYKEQNISSKHTADASGSGIDTGKKTFLTGIAKQAEGAYAFEYSTTQINYLPIITYSCIDHWGYWNGTSSDVGSLIVDPTVSTNRREPKSSYADVGLLTKVTYPTGGYTAFEYEPQLYNNYIIWRDVLDKFDVVGNSSTDPLLAGGARVKKITDNDGVKSKARMFSYENSGTLYDMPRYVIMEGYNFLWDGQSHPLKMLIISSIGKSFYSTDPYIMYSKVRETFSDGSYDQYTYSDFSSNGDDILNQACANRYFVSNYNSSYMRQSNSRVAERGLLLSKESHSPTGLIKKETCTYQRINSDSYVAGATLYGSVTKLNINSYKTYTEMYLPYKTTVSEVTPTGNIVKEITAGYNAYGQPTSSSYVDSHGTSQISETRYVTTLTTTTDPILDSMKNKNILKLPLETISSIDQGAGAKTIGSAVSKYTLAGNSIVPSSTLRLRVAQPISGYTGYYPTSGSGFEYDPAISFDVYDNAGRIRQVTTKEGVKVSYLWGYNNRYIIAKIEGADIATVTTAAGSTTLDALAAYNSDSSIEGVINTIRTNIGSSALITTYLYTPYVGITKVKDPTGREIRYTYDSKNRLQFIKDENNNILEAYDIKLHSEN